MGANVSHDGHISRVVRSRIFDDGEKCVVGANVLHDGPVSGSSVAHCMCSREWSGSSRIEDAGLVADVSMQDSQSKGGRKCLILYKVSK